jgi:chloramphenicol O-acetyltransferase type A
MKKGSYHIVKKEGWNRLETYNFFEKFEDSTFNITTNINVSDLVMASKKQNNSFSIYLLYTSLKAVNSIKSFKWRIEKGNVVEYDVINWGTTILFKDKTFGFCYFDYIPDFKLFYKNTRTILDNSTNNKSFSPKDTKANLIHYSSLPWFTFTSFKHPRSSNADSSIPKIVFGKFYKSKKEYLLPVSVQVHHSLIDGYQLGRFLEEFQNNCSVNLNYLKKM